MTAKRFWWVLAAVSLVFAVGLLVNPVYVASALLHSMPAVLLAGVLAFIVTVVRWIMGRGEE